MFVDTVQAIGDTLALRGYHMLLCIVGYEPEDFDHRNIGVKDDSFQFRSVMNTGQHDAVRAAAISTAAPRARPK